VTTIKQLTAHLQAAGNDVGVARGNTLEIMGVVARLALT
jgi:hypothetical protein